MNSGKRTKAVMALPHFHWTGEHYRMAVESGLLNSNHKLELLFGKLVARPRISPLRAAGRRKVRQFLNDKISKTQACVMVGGALTLAGDSEPEPDLMVARLPMPKDRHPNSAEVLLVVEVSDSTTIDRDRETMSLVYATSNIEEYWIVNVYEKQLERYTAPKLQDGIYMKKEVFKIGDKFTSIRLGEFAVKDLVM